MGRDKERVHSSEVKSSPRLFDGGGRKACRRLSFINSHSNVRFDAALCRARRPGSRQHLDMILFDTRTLNLQNPTGLLSIERLGAGLGMRQT